MAKTLLQLTQNILSDMDSDEVNSIYDTVESFQVATIILTTLESEFNNLDFPSFNRIVQLESVSDVTRPNYLRFGDVTTIGGLRYRDNRNSNRYNPIQWLSPEDFFDRQFLYTSNSYPMQEIIDPSGVKYLIRNDSCPHFWTSIDNNFLIFDSFDNNFEDTLEATNSFAFGSTNIDSTSPSDDYVPPIPNELFPLLLAEAKTTCFLTLKQMANPKQEQIARRQRSRMQHNLYKSSQENFPYARSKYNFGRNR